MSARFAHHYLDVYHLAVELAVSSKDLSERIPRGYRTLADQLIRSGPSVALLIAEGANRLSPAQKRQRFVEARGECGEAAATIEILVRMDLVPRDAASRFHRTADRVAAMLRRLICNLS
jgi:four helix bundle protein